jgi:cytochrome c peroxidase
MLGSDVTVEQIRALTAFVRQLGTVPANDGKDADRAAVRRGLELFERRDCADCHTPPTFTSADSYDVGLPDEQGTLRFNPPSLRGVGRRSRLFHDNRAASLREVFLKFGHGHDSAVDPAAIDDLVAFLRSL